VISKELIPQPFSKALCIWRTLVVSIQTRKKNSQELLSSLNEKHYHQVEQIRHAHRELDTADQLGQAFVLMLPGRRDKDLDARLLQAERCGIAERKS